MPRQSGGAATSPAFFERRGGAGGEENFFSREKKFSSPPAMPLLQRYRAGGTGGDAFAAADAFGLIDRFRGVVIVQGYGFGGADFGAGAAGEADFGIDVSLFILI